ncbi:S-adenosylmethionine decarboxylase [Phycisphaerae bacterium RAS1]|nr:S-adenosylmethionine decarboxylase [Phycisphaerae bacterium RAS1]
MIVHQHGIVIATVARRPDEITCDDLRAFLSGFVRAIDMTQLFEPIAIKGKFGFTGIVGIVTSHIAFHYFDEGQTLHFDVYSCKSYHLRAVLRQLDAFWRVESADVLLIQRDTGPSVRRFRYASGDLKEIS